MSRESAPLFDHDDDVWREVPAAVFLSWSVARQLHYCAERDDHSAEHAATKEEADWYRWRADLYWIALDAEKKKAL